MEGRSLRSVKILKLEFRLKSGMLDLDIEFEVEGLQVVFKPKREEGTVFLLNSTKCLCRICSSQVSIRSRPEAGSGPQKRAEGDPKQTGTDEAEFGDP